MLQAKICSDSAERHGGEKGRLHGERGLLTSGLGLDEWQHC
jgi:hypothetical protein